MCWKERLYCRTPTKEKTDSPRPKIWLCNLLLEQIAEKEDPQLSREDIIPLLFSPLMGGDSGQRERILKCIQILRNAEKDFSKNDIQKMEAVLYAFAVKFLDDDDLKAIKEAIAMTKLGQMIWDDAVEKGREEATERYSRLILLLDKDNRTDLIVKIAADPEYLEALYKEYGI